MSNLIRDFSLMIINLGFIKFNILIYNIYCKKEIYICFGRKKYLKCILLL